MSASMGTETTVRGGGSEKGQPSEVNQLNLAPSDSREPALVATLPHGNYTAIMSGKNGETGVGLLDVYKVSVATNR